MARPREFDTEALLDTASMAFLEDGLQQTSMRHLEDLTGVKQVSLYNAFGSKEGLFLAAFDRYTERVAAAQKQHLDDRGLDGIESFVKAIVSPDSPLPLAQCRLGYFCDHTTRRRRSNCWSAGSQRFGQGCARMARDLRHQDVLR